VDVLIDRRELLEKARQKGLNLMMADKDYVLGWLLFGFAKNKNLVFKGGAALSKAYFPKVWRLSEDLDFSLIEGELGRLSDNVETILADAGKKSGIEFTLKSRYMNPSYLQLKIQYQGVIGRNWIKADITPNDTVDEPVTKYIVLEYSDYVPFEVRVESLYEIFVSKLRAVIERKKCRDFFDLWKLSSMDMDKQKIKQVFEKKIAVKNLEFHGLGQIFPSDLKEKLKPYWERELGRLVRPLPDMTKVLNSLEGILEFL
jgi:predicted nucleotidyltransferase component of viral defense system